MFYKWFCLEYETRLNFVDLPTNICINMAGVAGTFGLLCWIFYLVVEQVDATNVVRSIY